jgi:hypothetical protein
MKSKTSTVQPSFYCNHCNEWVDGIEGEQSHPAPRGYRQALCDNCGRTVMYRLPSFWQKFQAKTSEVFDGVLRSMKRS